MTIAIVDAFGYPGITSDLATYRNAMVLPACPARTCFRILNQNGRSSPLPPGSPPGDDWYGEQALDVEMASAICPRCHIVLIEAASDSASNLYAAVSTATHSIHPNVVSMSWGGNEYAPSDRHFNVPGVTFVASSGDSGAGAQQPCSFASVVCVGGTRLEPAANARGWSETVWNTLNLTTQCGGDCGATGSGCSAFVPLPIWEKSAGVVGCRFRAEADVSAVASVVTPVAVYSLPEGGWVGIGGTSASAPIIAGVFALAGNSASAGGPKYIWAHRSKLFDVVLGNNVDSKVGVTCGSRWPRFICYARRGYDGPTGWGTPNGTAAF